MTQFTIIVLPNYIIFVLTKRRNFRSHIVLNVIVLSYFYINMTVTFWQMYNNILLAVIFLRFTNHRLRLFSQLNFDLKIFPPFDSF